MRDLRDRYGAGIITKVVTAFYADVLESEQLRHHFAHADMHTLVRHQAAFLEATLGGPEAFPRGAIEAAHERLGITDEEFEAMLGLLDEKMIEHGIATDDAKEVIARYRGYESEVVDRTG